MKQRLTGQRMDRIGPFHPYLVFAAVVMFDVLLLAALVTPLLVGADWIEDMIWPGGPEMLPF